MVNNENSCLCNVNPKLRWEESLNKKTTNHLKKVTAFMFCYTIPSLSVRTRFLNKDSSLRKQVLHRIVIKFTPLITPKNFSRMPKLFFIHSFEIRKNCKDFIFSFHKIELSEVRIVIPKNYIVLKTKMRNRGLLPYIRMYVNRKLNSVQLTEKEDDVIYEVDK